MRRHIGATIVICTVLQAGVATQQRPSRASASVLSEHHLEALKSMEPQEQAELLLERAINRYRGATEEIMKRAPSWLGRLKPTRRLESLFTTAINSDDMRVRVAAMELNLSKRGLERSADTIDRLEPTTRDGEPFPRVNALWDIGLLGNRGVQPERAFEIIMASLHDPDEYIRYWAVESLAFLGTDQVIEPLLDVFRYDPSPKIRERGACSLAQSGMLDAAQRWHAIPRLLDFAGDAGIDAETRGWVFQALRDITGQSLPQEALPWRTWYERRK